MFLRDAFSVAIGTAVLLICLFGALFLFSTQCFAPSDPITSTARSTSTPNGTQGGADPKPTLSSDDGPSSTPTSPATPVASATQPAPTATQAPATATTAPTQAAVPPPQPAATQTANFGGNWRVIDTVTEGAGAGQTFTFDVTLTQVGNVLSGGNGGIVMNGTVSGTTASVSFTQPALGISGSFTWTMGAGGNATGTYTSSVPNAGTSQLVRSG